MAFLRKNFLNILCITWMLLTMLSVRAAHADAVQGGGSKVETYSIELAFVTHLEARLPEQDVYVERVAGSGEVYRVTPGDVDMDAPLYKVAIPVPHNPFDAKAIGPHPKGEAFGMTLGEWLRHSGSGTYTCADGEGRLDTRFTGLVPNGVYTMWHAFTAIAATKPFSGFLDLPLGARDGSTSVFVADADGGAEFRHRFRPCLQMSQAWTTSLLAINYHSDGRTYAARPGDFGFNAHTPLILVLPPREAIHQRPIAGLAAAY